jgi:hypothetical protein
VGGGVGEGERLLAGEVEVGGGLVGVAGGAWQPTARDKITNPIAMRDSFFMALLSLSGDGVL